MHCLTAARQLAVHPLECTASLPERSGQWNSCNIASMPGGDGHRNSCNALPQCLRAVASGIPAIQFLTA